jgi:hypothetical protein
VVGSKRGGARGAGIRPTGRQDRQSRIVSPTRRGTHWGRLPVIGPGMPPPSRGREERRHPRTSGAVSVREGAVSIARESARPASLRRLSTRAHGQPIPRAPTMRQPDRTAGARRRWDHTANRLHVSNPPQSASIHHLPGRHAPTIINKITTNTVEIASIRIYARALQFSVEIARLGSLEEEGAPR